MACFLFWSNVEKVRKLIAYPETEDKILFGNDRKEVFNENRTRL